MTTAYSYAALNLMGVIVLILALMYILNRLKTGKFSNGNNIKIIQTVPIGTKEKLLLLDINNTKILVGSTPNHIETLYVYTESETEIEPTLKYAVHDDSSFSEPDYGANDRIQT